MTSLDNMECLLLGVALRRDKHRFVLEEGFLWISHGRRQYFTVFYGYHMGSASVLGFSVDITWETSMF